MCKCAVVVGKEGDAHHKGEDHQLSVLRRILDRFDVWPLGALQASAWRIATALGITVYDACYVALAEMQRVPLVTADRRLVHRRAALSVRVIPLASIA